MYTYQAQVARVSFDLLARYGHDPGSVHPNNHVVEILLGEKKHLLDVFLPGRELEVLSDHLALRRKTDQVHLLE